MKDIIIPIICGPTASGKSGASIRIAEEFSGKVELISADAFQVYKYMDIGTAKVSLEERQRTPHHLIDILEPNEPYSAGIFRELAEEKVAEILASSKFPIIVGGTNLYIKSLTDGIFSCPEIDPAIRIKLERELEEHGISLLFDRLKRVDLEYAAKITFNDRNKIIRALEVCEGLGISMTEAHIRYASKPKYKYKLYILERERSEIYADIDFRAKKMWQEGWVVEVENLLKRGFDESCPAFRAIGYREIAELVKNRENILKKLPFNSEIFAKDGIQDIYNALLSEKSFSGRDIFEKVESEVKKIIARDTRHFAKRQLTWLHNSLNENVESERFSCQEEFIDNVCNYLCKLL